MCVAPEERRRVEVPIHPHQRDMAQEVAPPHPLRHGRAYGPQQRSDGRGHEPVPPLSGLDDILVIPGEELVATVAREDDRHMLGGELRDHVGRDRRRVAEWLVEVPGQVLDDVQDVGLENQLVMLGAEALRHEAGMAGLIVRLLSESDGERLHRSRAQPGHGRHDRTRIDATAQEGAQWHVAHEMQMDGLLDEVAQPLDEVRFRPAVLGLEMRIPIALETEGAAWRGN